MRKSQDAQCAQRYMPVSCVVVCQLSPILPMIDDIYRRHTVRVILAIVRVAVVAIVQPRGKCGMANLFWLSIVEQSTINQFPPLAILTCAVLRHSKIEANAFLTHLQNSRSRNHVVESQLRCGSGSWPHLLSSA